MKTQTFIARITRPKTMAEPIRTPSTASLLPLLLLLLLTLPAAGQAQFTYTTNGGTVTIIGYTGPSGAVTIPDMINGLPVISIGDFAFFNCTNVTSVMIPGSVTSIGDTSFSQCTSLTNITIPDGVTSIGWGAFVCCTNLTSVVIPGSVTSIGDFSFGECIRLTNVTIPGSVTSIADSTFDACYSLTSVTIPNSVTRIEDLAFHDCTNLTGVHFQGDAPSLGGSSVFSGDTSANVYYLPGTTGWGMTFGDRPTALWFLPNPLILTSGPGFGVQSNAFGFIISWATNLPVVVEACTNAANHSWSPLKTNALSGGWSYFSDLQWTNYAARFYRVRSP